MTKKRRKSVLWDVQDAHQTFREANDPNTSADRLRQLSESKSGVIRAAVAANTSTPGDVIDSLCKDRRAYVLQRIMRRRCIH